MEKEFQRDEVDEKEKKSRRKVKKDMNDDGLLNTLVNSTTPISKQKNRVHY